MPGPGIPRRPLLALSTAVLLAHLAVLQTAPAILDAPDPATKRAWTTRTIVLNPVSAAAAATPAPVPRPQPVRPRPKRPLPPAQAEIAEPQPTATAANAGEKASPEAAVAEPPAPSVQSPDSVTTAAPAAPPPPRETTAQATAFTVPGSVRLKFDVTGQARQQSYQARAELLWLHDGSTYDARLEVSAFLFGSRVQNSSGRIGAQGLAPMRFGDKGRSELAAHFDRSGGRVTFSANTAEAPLLTGAQDRLSVLLQLASMLAGDPVRYPQATTISVQTVGPRDAEVWLFTVEGEERMRLAGAEHSTLKLTRNPRREFDQKVEAWFAPHLGYLPVRVRITQANGDFVDQQLREVEKP